ncbi:MAG: TonB-dependent receptor, partial [Acidobacteria bacterium]|nr:TonB-dependent receptor [Acidobacteriota bacterium]
LASNQSGIALAGQPPQLRIVARPRDAVQWAIYYQPILTPLIDPSAPATVQNLALRESLEAFSQGDLTAAFDRLEGIAGPARNERFYLYRAGLLLAVGRVEEASLDIDQALVLAPESGEAYALRAVISIAQNDPEQALVNGGEAVARSPRSSAARIALSYAQQANFELEAARETLFQAVQDQPDDNLAWARLAELRLSVGDLDGALEAAERATSLGPELGRTQTVLGFARLAQIKLSDAKAAFERAIGLESESSLARLGLGLAKIRDGELPEGRREIEIAAALDPNNALIRSYLGKAYFDERRDRLAEEQLNLAKQLDPNDPTPYFYDAIRKQTINRPVEALHDLQRSIELNNNRAVYRSRLLLDEDLAARSASLGRIYRDLGFEQLALVEGWKSVNIDPANYSAHRFLADTYAALPRHEIARVSELLQSQLRQPINITPIQPQLAQSNLFVLEGAGSSDPSFNEFGPLFTRDRFTLQANGIVGGNDIRGDDLVVAGIANRFSFSAGQYHFITDGFRENNDLKENIYNAFFQARLTTRTSVQAELRAKDSKRGDLFLRFDPDNFDFDLRNTDKVNSLRFGFHHVFTPNSDIIANVQFQRADFDVRIPEAFDLRVDEDGGMVEGQFLHETSGFKFTTGAGHTEVDRKDLVSVFVPFEFQSVDEAQLRHTNLYLYSQIDYLDDVTLTLGASADFFMGGIVDRDQFNPKVGVTWTPSPGTTLRAAVFRSLAKTLISDQTIEPTQVAGFSQFFIDVEGADTWRYGIAIDQQFSVDLYAGAEFSRRELEVPGQILFPEPEVILQAFNEHLSRGYFYWTPHREWAINAEYQYERFARDLSFTGPEDFTKLETHRVLLGAHFFHPSGLKANMKGTYVNQSGEFGTFFGTIVPGEDQFWVVDASVGYRLPRRWGLITLAGKNIFDEKFSFQDTDPANPGIAPDRIILMRFNLFF